MKYPAHTVTQPLSKKQAKAVEEALSTGKPIINAEYAATIERIVAKQNNNSNEHQFGSDPRTQHA